MNSTYLNTYSSISPIVSEADYAAAAEKLENVSVGDHKQWADDHIVELSLAGRAFKMIIDIPKDGDPTKAIIVANEFAHGISTIGLGQILRAKIAHTLMPEATLIVQPNPTLGQNYLHLSKEERRKVKDGDFTPYVDRVRLASETAEDVAVLGASQGATVALAYGGHKDTPAAATAIIEPASIVDRSSLELVRSFISSGAQLNEHVAANYDNEGSSAAVEALGTLGLKSLVSYGAGIISLDNLAAMRGMTHDTAAAHLAAIFDKSGSVVHAWGTKDTISPLQVNRSIEVANANNPLYRGYEIKGADHSITNAHILSRAALRNALELVR